MWLALPGNEVTDAFRSANQMCPRLGTISLTSRDTTGPARFKMSCACYWLSMGSPTMKAIFGSRSAVALSRAFSAYSFFIIVPWGYAPGFGWKALSAPDHLFNIRFLRLRPRPSVR